MPQGRVASVLGAAGHTTSFVYDAFGDMTEETDPASKATDEP
jgi:YD repeat-containing protein